MKITYSIITLFLSVFLACSSPKTITGEVNYAGNSEPGTLLLNTAGYGRTKKEAIINAEKNAIYNVLFKGIPGTQYALPLVADGESVLKKQKKYFDLLLDGEGYKRFMMLSDQQTGFVPMTSGSENIQNRVKIDVTSLRRDLETNQIIRKFGY